MSTAGRKIDNFPQKYATYNYSIESFENWSRYLPTRRDSNPLRGTVKATDSKAQSGSSRDVNGNTPLHNAARFNRIEVLEYLVNLGADVNAKNNAGETPLHMAAAYESLSAVLTLLRYGANPSAENYDGLTALNLADSEEIEIVLRGAMNNWIRAANGVAKEDTRFAKPLPATQPQPKHHQQTADDMNKKIRATTGL